MIKNLTIKNYILAKDISVDFDNGLQIITGETGAGKSILIGAIQAIFGKSVNADLLADNTKKAYLELSFDLKENNQKLNELFNKYDVEITDDEFFLAREIYPNNRNKSYLNGVRIPVLIAKEFKSVMLDFHSQRDQPLLLDNNFQLDILDKFGDLLKKRNQFSQLLKDYYQKEAKLGDLIKQEQENAEKLKLYKYQADELEKAEITIGEDEKLQQELSLLEHAEEILSLSAQMEFEIYESDNSLYDKINYHYNQISQFAEDNDNLKRGAEFLQNSLDNLSEAVEEIRSVNNIIELDKGRQEIVQDRLNELNRLKDKYQLSLFDITKYLHSILLGIEKYDSNKNEIKLRSLEIEKDKKMLLNKADKLSILRQKSAKLFEKEIQKNLRYLAIPNAEIKIRFDKVEHKKDFTKSLPEINFSGKDKIDFLFSANKGLKLQTLKDAASGGELSRLLLTIKKMLSDKLESKIIIFDEIDSGIGGKTAELIGEFMYEISKHHQIICITHLAQIASFADTHLFISKNSGNSETLIFINELDGLGRKEEIARMIAGETSNTALLYAEEILKKRELFSKE